jgi:5-deoxy-glucuronate isomerase
MSEDSTAAGLIFHSQRTPTEHNGALLSLTREEAGWESISFFVRKLVADDSCVFGSKEEEVVLVLLGGHCVADWGEGEQKIGDRDQVFGGLPYALYLPHSCAARIEAETTCEIAECRVPSTARLNPRLVTPKDVRVTLRGGGNASRQIVDVMPPDFPADKLMVVEVYVPSGNWAGCPPHKHDVHNPPSEVDLDEVYYFRTDHPAGYAHQRLYTLDGKRDVTLTVRDGDLVLVRDGYHPTVAGHGYNLYFLNFLAGSARLMANTEDPDHAWVKSTWKEMDPRLPLVGRDGT